MNKNILKALKIITYKLKIDKEIIKLKTQLSKACEFLELGAYSLELFKERSNSINLKVENLEKEKLKLEELSKNNIIERITQYIPLLEKCLKNYWSLDTEGKNSILKELISEIYYTKNVKGSRWNHDNIDKFSLDIKLRI